MMLKQSGFATSKELNRKYSTIECPVQPSDRVLIRKAYAFASGEINIL
jgi:hypothetical protein